jgi:L-seryl-tRNA(Ser) seleniumtransferase
VVNNCAAGLIVTLRALMTKEQQEVIVSRGELVEIGGGFRVPEVMQTSGATLREVGTTNRTRVSDYAKAICPQTAMLLQVHRSNFRMSGFVETPALADLVELGHKHSLPVVSDLGSGSMLDTQSFGMGEHEMTPREILQAGADLVLFSGDKLLGGPQAGIITGKRSLIDKIKQEPFFRAVRCDKLMLTALQSTALAYLEAMSQEKHTVPAVRLIQMAALSQEELRVRGQALLDQLQHPKIMLANSRTRFGGGTMPEIEADSLALKIQSSPQQVDSLLTALRQQIPPVIGYAREGAVWLDLRTVMPEQDNALLTALQKVLPH